jgi:hypothetical protein
LKLLLSYLISSAATKTDLYSWREIFQLYIEAEIFTSIHERDHGERSIEDSEKRLTLFAERVTDRGLGDERQLRMEKSRQALKSFLELNLLILNVKKVRLNKLPSISFVEGKSSSRSQMSKQPAKFSKNMPSALLCLYRLQIIIQIGTAGYSLQHYLTILPPLCHAFLFKLWERRFCQLFLTWMTIPV